jgi:hypothetical protein
VEQEEVVALAEQFGRDAARLLRDEDRAEPVRKVVLSDMS